MPAIRIGRRQDRKLLRRRSMRPVRPVLLFFVIFTACDGGADPPTLTKDEVRAMGGKADDGADLCELLGWYGDGVCDDFCPEPDPDCPPAPECDPFGARAAPPDLLIGPEDWGTRVVEEIDAATDSIDMLMYQIGRQDLVDALVRAATQRDVVVRAVLDRNQSGNASAIAQLTEAGAEIRASSTDYRYAHAKTLVIDHAVTVILSGNFNWSSQLERNYGIIDRDADDLASAQAIFEADWAAEGGPVTQPDLSCTRLVVSPVDARDRLEDLYGRASQRLDLSLMSISDSALLALVEARAAGELPVRVLLAVPSFVPANRATADRLLAEGIPVRFMEHLHAKLVLSDHTAFVGSENMSPTSLDRNREVGAFVAGEAGARASAQFELDWAAGLDASP
jgi:phosphatidylserine/phosphatidylglycerophosphate/cardiolipin synthase-like enzyme